MNFISKVDFEIDVRVPLLSFFSNFSGSNLSEMLQMLETQSQSNLVNKFLFFYPIYYPTYSVAFISDNEIRVLIKMEELWLQHLKMFTTEIRKLARRLNAHQVFNDILLENNIVLDDISIHDDVFSFTISRADNEGISPNYFIRKIARKKVIQLLFPQINF